MVYWDGEGEGVGECTYIAECLCGLGHQIQTHSDDKNIKKCFLHLLFTFCFFSGCVFKV